MINQKFPKSYKLKSRKIIGFLFEKNQSVKTGLVRVVFDWSINDQPLQIGVAVPKRNVRKAVDRNRIKRYFREAIRSSDIQEWNQQNERAFGYMMFIYQGRPNVTFSRIQKEINGCFERLSLTSKTYAQD